MTRDDAMRDAIVAEAKAEVRDTLMTFGYYIRALKDIGAAAEARDLEKIEGLLEDWLR